MGLHIAWDGPRIYIEMIALAVALYFGAKAFRRV